MIEYLKNHVPNAAELLLQEMKKDNHGVLEDSIVMNNLANVVNFLISLKESYSHKDFFPDSVILGICMR